MNTDDEKDIEIEIELQKLRVAPPAPVEEMASQAKPTITIAEKEAGRPEERDSEGTPTITIVEREGADEGCGLED
ncbi:MAG TPA: hypothetical protein VFZ23_17855 [Pyrinomonadaceae bacterium]